MIVDTCSRFLGSPGTPRRRARTSEQPLASPSTRELERVGAGRGGFSVKGAAAAAARARWAKYRLEKADDSDDGPRKPKARSSAAAALARRDRGAVADKLVEGTTIEIKGKEYTVGDDELVMDEDAKGETKIDADGALLGGELHSPLSSLRDLDLADKGRSRIPPSYIHLGNP